MSNTIDRLLKGWKEKIEVKEKHLMNSEKEYENIKKENFKDCQDNFKWLMIKTRHEALQKKLKTLLVQKLNDVQAIFCDKIYMIFSMKIKSKF